MSGTAGTGKSYLIGAIAQLLNDHCILTGTTGMASFNICGKTLHSALQLPVHQSSQRELQGAALQRLQLQLKDKHYLIIDEMSMMGHKMLAWVDKRLRQASGKLDSPLGGFSVILFGDFGQLPPVGDRPLYAEPSFNELSIYGHHIYQIFTTVVILDHVLRQGGTDPADLRFRELLLRLRAGTVTHDDWQMLLARSPNKVLIVPTLMMPYDSSTTKKVWLSTICVNWSHWMNQSLGSMPSTVMQQQPLQKQMMLGVYIQYYSWPLVHVLC